MKKNRLILWCLACALALWMVYDRTQDMAAPDGPPALTIQCNGQTDSSGFWHAGWDSPTAAFIADGDPPYSPYGRDNFPVFRAAPGDEVKLSFPRVPDHWWAELSYDNPIEEWSLVLYEGEGGGEISFRLPENCGGAYTVSASWDGRASGSASYGFIVENEDQGEVVVVEEVPTLQLSWKGETMDAWQGSWEWRVPDGPGEVQVVNADSSGLLEAMDSLPVIPARPGEEIRMDFSTQPHEVVVWAIPGRYADDPMNATSDAVPLTEGNVLVLPGDGTDVIYEVFAGWDFSLLNGGRSFYGFYVP